MNPDDIPTSGQNTGYDEVEKWRGDPLGEHENSPGPGSNRP